MHDAHDKFLPGHLSGIPQKRSPSDWELRYCWMLHLAIVQAIHGFDPDSSQGDVRMRLEEQECVCSRELQTRRQRWMDFYTIDDTKRSRHTRVDLISHNDPPAGSPCL